LRQGQWARFKSLVLQNPSVTFENEAVNRAKEIVLQRPDATLQEVAEEVGRSPGNLSNLIKAELARLELQGRAPKAPEGEEEEPPEPEEVPLELPEEVFYRRPPRLRTKIARTLDQEYAELISQLTEKTGWFNQVLTDLGFYSILLAFQAARVPPGKVPEMIEKFRRPEEFTGFVKDQLSALMAAVQNSERILELEDRVKELEAENVLLEGLLERSLERIRRLSTMLKVALAVMPRSSLERFLLAAAALEQLPAAGEGEEVAAP
jgi:hypothetical protein